MATIKDVAREARVSPGTVSAVINGKPWVSKELRQRIEEAIERLGFRPNLIARALYTKKTKTLALLVPSLDNPFFTRLLDIVEREANSKNYSVIVGNTWGSVEKVQMLSSRLLAMGVDGILASLSYDVLSSKLLDECRMYSTPVIGIGGTRVDERLDCSVLDEVDAAEQLAEHLIGLGHERIAFAGSIRGMTSAQRYKGVANALTKHGIYNEPDLFIPIANHNIGAAYEAMIGTLRKGVGFTALIALNDTVAIEAINALSDNGIDVPADVSVASFDNTLAAQIRPSLTSVEFPLNEMGQQSVTQLLRRIDGAASPYEIKSFKGVMIPGSSTAPVKPI